MTSPRPLAVGTIIGVLLVMWWFASGLTRRLERLEQVLSAVQVMQQQSQSSTLEHRASLEDIRVHIDRLEALLVGEMKSTADQREAHLDGLAQQFSVLEGRLDMFKDQLDIIESLLEGDESGQTGSALGTTNRRP